MVDPYTVGRLESMMSEAISREPSQRIEWTVEDRPSVATSHVWRPSRANARERRHMVQACRALRMQIKGFEDDFVAAKGHVPRGSERVPLASTYRQYREWKRDIRDHAASQIQATVRAALARRALSVVHTSEDEEAGIPRTESLQVLISEKRRVKQQLKDYDDRFYHANGRFPHKLEKEPIRELYERYHALKAAIQNNDRSSDPLV